MGIRKYKGFEIICDNCDAKFPGPDGAGFGVFDTKEQAEKNLGYSEWTKKNGKVVCESCYEEI